MPTFYSDDLADKNRVDPHFCDDNEMKHFQHNDSDVYVKHRWFFYSLESSELTCPTLWFSTVCCSLSGVFGFSELVEKLQLKLFRQQKLPCSREVCSPPLKGLRSKSSEEKAECVYFFLPCNDMNSCCVQSRTESAASPGDPIQAADSCAHYRQRVWVWF